jgi:hypothetical protein
VWDSLQEQVTVERDQLHRLLDVHHSLLEKCAAMPPNEVELSALAAISIPFTNGIENIFKRTTLELGDACRAANSGARNSWMP